MSTKTQRLFDDDPHLRELEAKVIEISALPEGQGVVLDRTLFYPEGGGQPSDKGTLNGIPVSSVFEEGGEIVHVIDGKFNVADSVKGILDWERRFDHMQQHSGQHLLSQAFIRVLEAETLSFHLGSEDSTVDLDIAVFSEEGILEIEAEANRLIYENRSVLIHSMRADELDSVPLRKRPAMKGNVRIVEIEEYDWSLCCGTHVRRTGEIGLIKVLRPEKYKGGTRVHFACGSRALQDYQTKAALIKNLSRILTAGENDMVNLVGRWKEERKTSEKRIQALLEQSIEVEAEKLLREARPVGAIKMVSAVFRDRSPQEVQSLVRKLVQSANVIAIVCAVQEKATMFIARSSDMDLDVRLMLEVASKTMNGKGGGNSAWAQCSTAEVEKVEEGMRVATHFFLDHLTKTN
jgi:alanyl-tRNA synthetase